jgi:HD-GYP domain-containing protein (c-di-GMP phosphodiesterase class II)
LTIPLANTKGVVIGVIQLINARDAAGAVKSFSRENQRVVEALCSQAAIALDNQLLLDDQKELLESFIKLIASAIDAKSPYTGAHCERVPILTEMLARSACEASEGPLKDFDLNEEEWYELHIAAWLHDCGKITTPVHVMDKATKLETITDRIETIRARFEILRRDSELRFERQRQQPGEEAAKKNLDAELAALDAELAFLETSNVGGEFLPPDKQARIAEIGRRSFVQGGQERPLLSEEDVACLQISRGTLLPEERIIINGHMVQTIKMLESLPFPRNLRRVPEYAGGHHEKMDGTGYPKGIFASDMSLPARMMAIADVFEALTADDRPYKKAKKLSEAMRIMGFMKKDNHLDPDVFDHFVRSGVYLEYAKRFLDEKLIDEVDERALLAIEPKPYQLADEQVRRQRWRGFLSEFEEA